jgi:hypothetical protein
MEQAVGYVCAFAILFLILGFYYRLARGGLRLLARLAAAPAEPPRTAAPAESPKTAATLLPDEEGVD